MVRKNIPHPILNLPWKFVIYSNVHKKRGSNPPTVIVVTFVVLKYIVIFKKKKCWPACIRSQFVIKDVYMLSFCVKSNNVTHSTNAFCKCLLGKNGISFDYRAS